MEWVLLGFLVVGFAIVGGIIGILLLKQKEDDFRDPS